MKLGPYWGLFEINDLFKTMSNLGLIRDNFKYSGLFQIRALSVAISNEVLIGDYSRLVLYEGLLQSMPVLETIICEGLFLIKALLGTIPN